MSKPREPGRPRILTLDIENSPHLVRTYDLWGANITPDKLPRAQREALESPCNEALVAMTELLRPRLVIGVGAFARAAAERALKTCAHRPEFAQILHPSPASPAANRGWEPQVRADLVKLRVIAK